MSSRQNEKNGDDSLVKWNCRYPVWNWSSSLKSEAQPVATLCVFMHNVEQDKLDTILGEPLWAKYYGDLKITSIPHFRL